MGIVEELRKESGQCACEECCQRRAAADEIERLQGQVAAAHALKRLREDEIERLRSALRRCRDMVGHPDNIAFIDAALEQEVRK